MKLNKVLLASAMASLWVCAQAQTAQATEPQMEASEFAFDVADRDGDGVISEAELAYDTAAGFAGLDVDGDEHLVPGELQSHDPADFRRADTSNDGRLSWSEVIKVKLKVFEDADTNNDGVLSKDEVLDYDAQRYGRAGS